MLELLLMVIAADFVMGVAIFMALEESYEDEKFRNKQYKLKMNYHRPKHWLRPGTEPPMKQIVEHKKKKGLLN